MATTLGALVLELGLDDSRYKTQLVNAQRQAIAAGKQIERQFKAGGGALNLKAEVDDSQLYELNQHLDLKRQHFEEVQSFFAQNPLQVRIDVSEIEQAEQGILRLQNVQKRSQLPQANYQSDRLSSAPFAQEVTGNTNHPIEIRSASIEATLLRVNESVEKAASNVLELSNDRIRFDQSANRFRWAEGENKGQYVSNAVVQAVTGVKLSIDKLAKQQEQTSIESIKEGFFEGIGENFGNQIGQGIQRQVTQRYGADIKKFGNQLQEVFNPNKLNKFEDALVSILEDLFVYSDEQERNQKLGQYAQRFGTGVKEVGMQVAGQGVKLAAQPLRIRKRVQLARSMELATQMADEIEVPDLEDPDKIKRIALLSGGVDYQEGGLNTYFSRNVMKNVLGDDTEAVPVPNVYSNSKDLGRLFDVKKALVQGLSKVTGNAELNEMGEEIPVDKLLNIAIEAGFNPDAVIMEAVRRAYEKKYPDKQFVFGGTSAGTIAAEEATAIAERGGATNTKGFGATLGLTGLTQTASPENFKAIVGDLDPLYLTLFGSGGIDRESLTKTQRKVLDATMKEMPLPPDLLQGMLKPSANTEVVKGAGMAHHLGQFIAEPEVQKILSEFLGTEQTPEFQGKAGTSAFKTYADMFSQYEALDRTFRALAGEQTALEEMGQGKYAFVTPEGKLRKNFGPEQERFDLEYAADEFQVNKRVKGVAAEEGQKFKRIMGDLVGALKDVEEVDPTKIEAIAKEFRNIFGTAPKLKEGDRDRIERIAKGESPEEVGFKLERTGPRLEDLEKLKREVTQAEAEAIAVPEPKPNALTEAAKGTKSALTQEMPPEQVSGNMAIAFAEKAGGILKEMASGAGEALGRKAEEILVSRINNLLAQVPGQRDVLEANPRQIQKVSDLTPEDIQRLSALGTEDLVKLLGSGANIAGNVAKGGAAIAIGTGQAIAPIAAQGAKALGSKAQQAIQGTQEAGLIEESQRRIMALKSAAEKAGALLPGRQNQGKAYVDVVTKLLPELNKEIDQAIASLPPADRMATREGSQLANLKSQVSKLEKQMQGLVEQLRQAMAQQEEVSGEDIIDAEVISEIETLAFGEAQVRQLQAAQPPPIQPPSVGAIQKQIKDLGKSFSVQSKAITTLGADSAEGRQIAKDIANAADEAKAAIESLLDSLGDNATTGLRRVAGATRQRITKAEKKASQVLDAEGDARNVGQDVGAGLNQGIRGSIQEVQQTARLLAQAAIESTKDKLDIQSPSKVFRWIGRQVGTGFRVGVTESLKAAVSNSPVGEFAKRSKKESQQVAQDFKVHFGQAKQFVTSLLKTFVGFQVISFIGPFLQDFARQSIEAAMGAQQLERSLTFVMGSAQAAKETIRALRDEANELGTNAAASIQGYFQIAASTRDTSLEGVATEQIAGASSSAASAYNLSIAQAESVNTAISQMASKGKVSAEELRQQLSEALPGAFQVAARAMGVTTQELDRMLDRGELLSEEFLPRFAQQLSAETSAGVAGAANSAQASLNRLENQINELRVAFGEGVIPVRKLGTDLLTKALEGLVKILPVLTTLGATFAARFAGNLIVTMNLGAKAAGILLSAILRLIGVLKAGAGVKGFAAAIALLKNNLLSAAKATLKFAVQFAIIQGVIDLAKMMGKAFKDGGEEINQFADQAIQSMEKYKAAIAEARGETEDFFASLPKGKSQIQGESLLEDFLFLGDIFGDQNIRALEGGLRKAFEFSPSGFLMSRTGREPISQAEKVATDQEIARNEVMGQMNRTLSEVYNQIGLDGQGANEVARLRELDEELERLQGRRRAIRPGDSSARRQLDAEIDSLLREREVLAKPVGQLQQKLAAEVKAIEATIQELDEKAAADLVDRDTYEKQSKQLQEQLEAAQSAQDKFNGLVRQSVNIVGMLSREFQGVSDRLRDMNVRIEIGSALQRRAIADIRAGGATAGQTRTLEYLSQQDELRKRIEANQEAMRELSSLLSGSEVTRALDITGIGSLESIGPSELTSRAERLGEGREREVLEIAAQRYEELQQLQVETVNLEAEIANARANAQETMVQLSKDIAQFYRDISEQAKELAIATKESQNQTALMQAKSQLQQALVGFSKSFLNEFVNSLIGLVEALNEPLQNAIAAQQQILSASQGYQQILQQGMGFQQMMPGMMPGQQQLGGQLGAGTLVGIGGNSGRSTGPHLDIRYSRSYDPNRDRPTDEHLDRFAIDGVPLTQGRLTSEHRSRNSRRPGHDGVDFGLNVGAQITTTVPIQSVSQPIWDEGGGGWYTTVTFEDGVQMNLLHLDPTSRNAGIGTGGAPVQQAAPRQTATNVSIPRASGPGRIPRGGTISQAERVQSDPAGAAAIVQAAQQLGLDPSEFAALMSWESAGTFNPNIRGGDGNAYKGLIQFSPSNQQQYGTGGQQSIAQQMPAIVEYLQDRGFRPGEHNIQHAYSAVLVGNADESYWHLRDSNGTSVRNAAPRFQQGDHYERGIQFLRDSGVQVSGGVVAAIPQGAAAGVNPYMQPGAVAIQNQLGGALGMANQNLEGQIANIQGYLEAQNLLSQVNIDLQTQNAESQIEEARRQMQDQDRGYRRQIQDLQLQAGPQTPEREMEGQLVQIDRQYQDLDQGLSRYVEQLNATLGQSDQIITAIHQLSEVGAIPNDMARSFINQIESTVTAIAPIYEDAQGYVEENQRLRDELRQQAIEEFERQEQQRQLGVRGRQVDVQRSLNEQLLPQLRREGDGQRALVIEQGLAEMEIQLSLDQAIAELNELERTGQLTEEEVNSLREAYEQLNQVSLENLERQIARQQRELDLNQRTAVFDSEQQVGEAMIQRAELNGFGNAPGVNQMREDLAVQQANLNLEQQLLELEQVAEQAGYSADAIEEMRQNLILANEINLENIRQQFDDLQPVVEAVKQPFEGFFADILSGTVSVEEAFQRMIQSLLTNLAQLAAQKLVEGLFGSLLGGGGGGGFGSILGGLFGFKDGGVVPSYANGGLVAPVSGMAMMREGTGAIADALKKEGPNSVLAALTPGEIVLTVAQSRAYQEMGLDEVLNFSQGGTVPGGPPPSSSVSVPNGGNTVIVPVTVNTSGNGGEDQASALGGKLKEPRD